MSGRTIVLAGLGLLLVVPLIVTIYLAAFGVEPRGTGVRIFAAILGALLILGSLGGNKKL